MNCYIRNCTFENNRAKTRGGAITIQNSALCEITDSNFTNNSVEGESFGKQQSGGAIQYYCSHNSL